jgi:uncharacterized membrane protein (DUF485 family)
VSTTDPSPPAGEGLQKPTPPAIRDWEAVEAEPEFQELRSRLRNFVFPVAGLFLGWYLLYVLLANYAPAFMATPVLGNINIGLIFGLLQFVSTFAITAWYIRWADRKFDPLATQLRDRLEGEAK